MKRLLFLLVLAQTALATDVWFGDVEATSPDRRYRATAKSPENRKKEPGPFQNNFTFSLSDTHSQKRLWRYGGGADSEPAGSLFVSNSGRVISLGGYDRLTFFRPSGERIVLPGVFEILPKREVEKFCDTTTAGTFWSQFSWNGFFRSDGREYFFIRTYWGRYILVDLERERISTERRVEHEIEETVLSEARQIRSLPAKKYRTYCAHCRSMEVNPTIQKGAFVLVRHHEKDLDVFLRLIFSANDHIFPDAKEYLPRLDPGLARKFPKREDPTVAHY
jgi:hypothetical protein